MQDHRRADDPGDAHFLEAVRRTAYFLWEQDGRPDGRHEHYWQQAFEQHRRQRDYDRWLEAGPQDGEVEGE